MPRAALRAARGGGGPLKLYLDLGTRVPRETSLERHARQAFRPSTVDRETGLLPFAGPPDDSPSASGKVPRDYQLAGAAFLRSRVRALLGDEPGVGKTCQGLRALPFRAQAIVVCPSHLRLVWRDECFDWRPDLVPSVDSLRAPRPGELLVASVDGLPEPASPGRLVEADLRRCVLLFDEAQYAKNPRALRTRRLRMLARQCGRVWGFTGTPLLGKPPDLWGVLVSLGLETEAYGDWHAFGRAFQARQRVVRRNPDGTLVRVTEYGEALPEAREGLARVMLRRLRREVLGELPPVIEREIRLEAPADLRAMLDQTLAAWQEWGDPTDLPPFELMSAALAALSRARIPDAVRHVWDAIGDGDHVLAFSAYRDPVLAVGAIPGCAAITGDQTVRERHDIVERFQAGKLRCVAGTIDAMGTGLTMTAASRVLLVDESYTPAETDQAIGRALRHGQQNERVLVEWMVTDHPLDARRREIIARKRALIGQVVGS